MDYRELLDSGANVSITVNLQDLQNLFKQVSGTSKPENEKEETEEFLSRKNTLTLLNIVSSTFWNLEKTGYIVFHPFGGRKCYKKSEKEHIRTGKKGK